MYHERVRLYGIRRRSGSIFVQDMSPLSLSLRSSFTTKEFNDRNILQQPSQGPGKYEERCWNSDNGPSLRLVEDLFTVYASMTGTLTRQSSIR